MGINPYSLSRGAPSATSSNHESGILHIRHYAARGVAYLCDFMR